MIYCKRTIMFVNLKVVHIFPSYFYWRSNLFSGMIYSSEKTCASLIQLSVSFTDVIKLSVVTFWPLFTYGCIRWRTTHSPCSLSAGQSLSLPIYGNPFSKYILYMETHLANTFTFLVELLIIHSNMNANLK